MCVCVPLPTHCTITYFGLPTRQTDGVKCGLFSNHASLGQTTLRMEEYLYSLLEKVEVRVTVSVTLCSIIVLCGMVMMMMKGSEKVKPGAGS